MYLTITQNLTRYPKWNLISYGKILIYISTKDEYSYLWLVYINKNHLFIFHYLYYKMVKDKWVTLFIFFLWTMYSCCHISFLLIHNPFHACFKWNKVFHARFSYPIFLIGVCNPIYLLTLSIILMYFHHASGLNLFDKCFWFFFIIKVVYSFYSLLVQGWCLH